MPTKRMLASSKVRLNVEDLVKPRSSIYLPHEGLQGEDIPSHILWENMKVETVQVSFRPPLKFKDIFNAGSWAVNENTITIKSVELDGYVGFSFETSKVSELEIVTPIDYILHLSNGELIKETKMIKLFRPQLEIKVQTPTITIDPSTEFVKGRIRIKNVGRGVMLLHISATENSSIKVETPPEHRKFAEKFLADLSEEMSRLAQAFPSFKPFWEQTSVWEKKEFMELTAEEREGFAKYVTDLGNLLASDRNLLQGFIEGYAKAYAKNSELIEVVRKVINVYESLVSKDILLLNSFDEAVLEGKSEKLALVISQTDRVFDDYDDIELQIIELASSSKVRIPVYKLFEWG